METKKVVTNDEITKKLKELEAIGEWFNENISNGDRRMSVVIGIADEETDMLHCQSLGIREDLVMLYIVLAKPLVDEIEAEKSALSEEVNKRVREILS